MQKKIKILHLQETIGSGGVERRRLSLARHLDKKIFDQKFICTFAKGNIPEEIRAEGCEVIAVGQLKSPLDWTQHKKVQKIIEEYKPDIIHGAVFEGVTMAAINGWLKKVPYVIIEETSDPINRSWKANMLMKIYAMFADKVIGVSEAVTKEYLIEKLNLPKDKVVLINNGVALPRQFRDIEVCQAKVKWGIQDNDFVIGSIGRMLDDSNKRFSDLIKAFSQFSSDKTDTKLLLVGTGPELKNYRILAEKLNVTDQIIFTDYQSDVTLLYQMMNVFSLLSTHESFGLVLAEAMLNKLPVIATRAGGMKYIVDHENTGFLVDVKNVFQIREKMERLYQNRALASSMGERGYAKALSQYTESEYVHKVHTLYYNLYKK